MKIKCLQILRNVRDPQNQLNELQKLISCRIAQELRISHPCLATLLLKARPNGQILLDEHFEFCLSRMLVRLATTTKIACLSNFLELLKNIFDLSQAKNVCEGCACVVAKPTNTMLDKQNFKYLPNNVGSFGRGSS